MKLRHLTLLVAICAAGSLASASAANAAPIFNLDVHHNETNFPPGGNADLWFDVSNVGDTATSGPVTLTVFLPSGFTRHAVHLNQDVANLDPDPNWSCPGSAGDSVVVCTTTEPILAHRISRRVNIAVNVAGAPLEALRTVTARVQGGGTIGQTLATEQVQVSPDPAGFGILPSSFVPGFFEADGKTPVSASGSHPDLFTVPFDFHTIAAPNSTASRQKAPDGTIRNIEVTLPPGFLGDPTAVSECSQAAFSVGGCPRSSQVGRIDFRTNPIVSTETGVFTTWSKGVYNLFHPRGDIVDLAFVVASNPVHIRASLDPANGYAVTSEVRNINESIPVFDQKLTLWGVPADSSHDSECFDEKAAECPTDAERKPFLTVPFQCEVDHKVRLHSYDSWQNTGDFGPEIEYTLPGQTTDCDRPRFDPTVEIEPTGKQANTPTGLDVRVKVPQNKNPNALYTPPVKSTTVTLPEGMTFSPSFADGLEACTPAQIGLFTNDPVGCPPASRIGEVRLSTPLLPKEAVGSMYLAAQGDNPFHSTFAIYLTVEDTEERGVLVKIPGEIEADPVTGQITTSFDDLPQFPFDDFTLKFRSGPRAPLVSPPNCGTHEIEIEIASYAQPTEPVDASSTYEITEGPGGAPCINDPGARPFAPRMNAGTVNPNAGAYSPFVFRMTRADEEQELSQIKSTLPPGLVAKIAGVSFCPDAALASISSAEGTGRNELNNPACPASSQVGALNVGAGSGPGPNYFGGKAYLAGPYKGNPISLAIVVPAIAGPIDLGSVVVRTALEVNTETAQVRAISDPFPTILHGVLLRVRDVRLKVDRPETTINPTSCDPMSITGQITGVGGSIFTTADDSLFDTSNPFQVANCANLGFKPKLSFRLFGGTQRGAHPKLRAVVRMPQGGANIASASVALPKSAFLDQSHIGTVCTRVQFRVDQCPAGSIYGFAEAKSPLLEEVLKGPVYLRSSDNPLPDLVAAFRGGKIDVDLVGRIDSVNQGIRNTFDLVPDAPVSWAVFTFQGGKKGLLINSRNLCKKTYRATAKFTAHSGRRVTLRPEMQNSCRKARKGAKRARHWRAR